MSPWWQLGALVGWLGLRAHQSQQTDQQRAMYLAACAARRTELTTISYTEVDADIQTDTGFATGSSTTTSRNARSRSSSRQAVAVQVAGHRHESALGPVHGDAAQALVSSGSDDVHCPSGSTTTATGGCASASRKMGEGAKVSNVEFVPLTPMRLKAKANDVISGY